MQLQFAIAVCSVWTIGDLLRSEQIAIVKEAVAAIYTELKAGRDMVNRVLYIAANGTKNFETLPPDMSNDASY
jgi:hypothetical protein